VESFYPVVEQLSLIMERQSLDGNEVILKDAALRCLGCIVIDCPDQLVPLINFTTIANLCALKRVQLTETVLWTANNFFNQNLCIQFWRDAGLYK
jgi:hypothetical protein